MNEENNLNSVEPVTPVTPTENPIDQSQVATPVSETVQSPVQEPPVESQIDPSFGTNVEVPVQPVPAPTKKKSKLPIILIVLIILAGGGFAVWKFVLPNINKTADETTTTAEILAGVQELTDKNIIAKLDKAVDFYSSEGINPILEDKYEQETYKLTDNAKKAYLAVYNTKKITDENELNKFNSSSHSFSDQVTSFYGDYDSFKAVAESDEDSMSDVYIYDTKDVAAIYKEMFNEEFDAKSIGDLGKEDNDTWTCPSFIYDSSTDKYVRMQACGGDSGETHLRYTYKYEKEINGKEETYYAYVAVGHTIIESSGFDYSIYLYYSYMNNYQKDDMTDDEGIEDYKINETNYEKFDKFRYVFVKDATTGNIYVDHIEHVK